MQKTYNRKFSGNLWFWKQRLQLCRLFLCRMLRVSASRLSKGFFQLTFLSNLFFQFHVDSLEECIFQCNLFVQFEGKTIKQYKLLQQIQFTGCDCHKNGWHFLPLTIHRLWLPYLHGRQRRGWELPPSSGRFHFPGLYMAIMWKILGPHLFSRKRQS